MINNNKTQNKLIQTKTKSTDKSLSKLKSTCANTTKHSKQDKPKHYTNQLQNKKYCAPIKLTFQTTNQSSKLANNLTNQHKTQHYVKTIIAIANIAKELGYFEAIMENIQMRQDLALLHNNREMLHEIRRVTRHLQARQRVKMEAILSILKSSRWMLQIIIITIVILIVSRKLDELLIWRH